MVANRHRAGDGVLVMAGRHARRASTTEFARTSGNQFLSLTYHRDADSQLTQGSATQQYGYDNINRVNSWTSSGANTTYGYDAADRLGSITGSATTTLTYDTGDQLSSFVTTTGGNTIQNLSYSSDSQGNRTQVTDNIVHSTTTLGYDQANRLKSYGASATYQYDGNGLRASKTVSGTTTNYTWDVAEGLPLMIKDNNTSWIYGPGRLVVEQITSTNTVYYYHEDQLGSTRKVTDASGGVVRSYTFDPWGNISSTTGTLSTPVQFAGQFTDMESGLYYMRARFYDALSGQFVSVDPIISVTKQRYLYALDNPLNTIDPGGLDGGSGFANALWDLIRQMIETGGYGPEVEARMRQLMEEHGQEPPPPTEDPTGDTPPEGEEAPPAGDETTPGNGEGESTKSSMPSLQNCLGGWSTVHYLGIGSLNSRGVTIAPGINRNLGVGGKTIEIGRSPFQLHTVGLLG